MKNEKKLTNELIESYRYHTLCARSTLYSDKSIEEVKQIIDGIINKWNEK
jgi:hypothetical protein